MKKNLQIIVFIIVSTILSTSVILSQNVGINATGAAPDASAMLDIVSANRGLLIPRVALTATNVVGPIAAPTTSLLVYNTATAGVGLTAVTPGYYYWDGAAWVRFQASNTIDDWKLLGNAGTTAGTNFVGTTDAQHLDFRTNNTQRMRIMNSTHPTVGIGTAFPVTNLSGTTAILHVHDGGGSVGSQLILSNSSTTSGDRSGLINFSATQVTNDRRTASIESYLTNYTAPNATGDLRFFTNNANSYTEKMRIEGDGDIGIGTVTPNASAKLDITATNRGLLIPRVALTATNAAGPITAPATSLLVYNTATAGAAPNNVTPGYYYWDGAAWDRFDTENNVGDWKILGNANTTSGTNFLGTTNGQALDFRTNNTIRFRIANADQVHAMALGTAALPFYSWNGDANTGIFTPVADVIGFSTNGTERFRIPNANQVHAMSNGTAALPFYSWNNDPNTGMSSLAADQLNWSTGGVERLQLTNTQLGTTFLGTAAAPAYSFTGDLNTGMYSPGADILAFSTTGAERMRILADGRVSINNAAPVAGDVFTVNSTSAALAWGINSYNSNTTGGAGYYETTNAGNGFNTIEVINSTGANFNAWFWRNNTGNNTVALRGTTNANNNRWGLYSDDEVLALNYFVISDERLKSNITNINSALNSLNQLRPVEYTFNNKTYPSFGTDSTLQYGFLAAEVQTIFPNLVAENSVYNPNELPMQPKSSFSGINPEFSSVNYIGLIPITVKAIQEQQAIIEDLLKRIELLELELKNK